MGHRGAGPEKPKIPFGGLTFQRTIKHANRDELRLEISSWNLQYTDDVKTRDLNDILYRV